MQSFFNRPFRPTNRPKQPRQHWVSLLPFSYSSSYILPGSWFWHQLSDHFAWYSLPARPWWLLLPHTVQSSNWWYLLHFLLLVSQLPHMPTWPLLQVGSFLAKFRLRRVWLLMSLLISRPGKARCCSTRTVVIKWVIFLRFCSQTWVFNLGIPLMYRAPADEISFISCHGFSQLAN